MDICLEIASQLAKAIAKATLVGLVAVSFMVAHRGEFMSLMDQPLQQALADALRQRYQAAGRAVSVECPS